MKVKMLAIVTFEWEEDSEGWGNVKTPEDLLTLVQNYVKDDMNYVLESNIADCTVEIAS